MDNVIECCDLILAGQDDRQPITLCGVDLFAVKATDASGARADGKEGTLLCAPEKAR